MAFSKKTWLDRIAEYPTRRRLKKSDGTDEIVSVSREEGAISQEGDAFSAANMNDLEDRVASEFNSLNIKLQEVNKNLFTAHPQYNTSADMIKKMEFITVQHGQVRLEITECSLYLEIIVHTYFNFLWMLSISTYFIEQRMMEHHGLNGV